MSIHGEVSGYFNAMPSALAQQRGVRIR